MMNETTSKTDSSLVLWGEIEPNCNPFDATNLWRPINEYQNINVDHERNINKNSLHSDNNSLAAEDDEDMNHDPIGFRIIELRKYYLFLNQQLRAKQKAAEKLQKRERKYKKKYFAYPEFPPNYPFCQSFEKTHLNSNRRMIKLSSEIPKYLLEKKRAIFIISVIEQAGIFDIEDENTVLNTLSAILDDFLQKFVTLLCRNKNSEPFSKDKDLWNALETTLRKFGICGISALHVFYYENVVKKHDILERKCKDICDELQKS